MFVGYAEVLPDPTYQILRHQFPQPVTPDSSLKLLFPPVGLPAEDTSLHWAQWACPLQSAKSCSELTMRSNDFSFLFWQVYCRLLFSMTWHFTPSYVEYSACWATWSTLVSIKLQATSEVWNKMSAPQSERLVLNAQIITSLSRLRCNLFSVWKSFWGKK